MEYFAKLKGRLSTAESRLAVPESVHPGKVGLKDLGVTLNRTLAARAPGFGRPASVAQLRSPRRSIRSTNEEPYMAKSPEEMKAAMIAGLREKTGKSLEEWLKILRASKRSKHKEFMTLLKEEHGLTHGFANMIALQALESDSHTAGDTGALVDAQYAGVKANLRPIYEKLLTAVQKFGDDVEASPKKAYVSLRRLTQF